ncbi:GTPase IMAP family member 6-like [Misgurnus anguillicaudatus]|uniref:GTPase IMAP family member 6-like n=1 Tax=Misgurnus anguillicaudatus TaxID=75329 RepID=UPI003CCF25AF
MAQEIPKLTFVLFGNSTSIQFGYANSLLSEKPPEEEGEFYRIVRVHTKISERDVSVINMIDLHDNKCYKDFVNHLIGKLMYKSKIFAFIFVVRLGQLTDADKMSLEWLQSVFGDGVFQFVSILFTYEREEESDTIIDDLKKNTVVEQLLNKCGERYHICSKTMNNRSEMRELIKKIDCLFNENQGKCYTEEMYNTQLREREDQKKFLKQ